MRLRRVDFPVLSCEKRVGSVFGLQSRAEASNVPVVSDNGNSRVHVDSERKVSVEVVLLLARVREGNVRESDDGRRESGDVLELERDELGSGDLLDETGSLHLVDNLLLGLGLLDQVGVGSGGSDELLDVGNLLLLLGVGLHLVGLVLGPGSDVGRVVTSVVDHLLLDGEVHDVGADRVHEVLRVRGLARKSKAGRSASTMSGSIGVASTHEDEDVVVGGEVSLEPDDGSEIQMRRRLVEEEKVGLDEERSGKSDSHPPSSRHVLGGLGHHGRGETETVENSSGLGLEHSGVHLLNLLVDGLEGKLVNVVGDRKVLGELLKSLNLGLGRGDDVVESVDIGGLDGSSDEVDIDVLGDLDVSLGNGLQEGRLCSAREMRSGQGGTTEGLSSRLCEPFHIRSLQEDRIADRSWWTRMTSQWGDLHYCSTT
jgi:hypothetical protein